MLLPHNAVVAVADGHHLNLFRNAGKVDIQLEAMDSPHIRGSESEAGSGGRHHSSSANPDEHRLDEDDFAAATADWLNNQVLCGKIDALFIIASPKTLGELRLRYHPELRFRLVGEEAKELVGHPRDAVEAVIAGAK